MDKYNFAIIDLETTGGSPFFSRVIEIGALRVEKGEVIQTFQTLLNPGLAIPEFITEITGITDGHIEGAPVFEDVMDELLEFCRDTVLVAHNAQFDYGFLRAEFSRADRAFTMPRLCTVRLSRVLFPEHKRHNLSALIERYDFSCPNRHRAFDDARVLWDFLQMVQGQFPEDQLEAALQRTIAGMPPKKQHKLAKASVPEPEYIYEPDAFEPAL